jgi:hypothetical protein
VHPAHCFAAALACATLVLRADPSHGHALRAQAILEPDIWSQVVEIENEAPRSRYPRKLYALVFEFAGILWFYTHMEGTQSFSLHVGNLDREKADYAPLLRAIEPGFVRWRVVPAGPRSAASRRPSPRNACFIESIAALRERLGAGEPLRNPRLLSYYVDTRQGRRGHTVLAYERGGSVELIDPSRRGSTFRFSLELGADPLELARAFNGRAVVQARVLAIEVQSPGAGSAFASGDAGPDRDADARGPAPRSG